MELLILFADFVDRLDPSVAGFFDYFRDEHVPLRLSLAIVAAALFLLVTLIIWGGVAWARIARLRGSLRAFGGAQEFANNFAAIDRMLSSSIFGSAWIDYRECLKKSNGRVFYPRSPQEYLGLHALRSTSFPARFFAAAHGYFIGVGLLLTFVGLVAALKFAAAGVASSDLVVAKEALNALLSAASFKFMTSIAGLGCSLLLSVTSRVMTYLIEGATHGLAADLERNMTPIFSECVAYDQLVATREQLAQLRHISTALATASAPARQEERAGIEAKNLQSILATFAAELRASVGQEMKQLTGKLAEVGQSLGGMHHRIDNSGQLFAEQLGVAASHLLNAATTLQGSVDGRAARVGDRIDALAETFAKTEAMFAASAQRAAQGMAQSIKSASDELGHGVVQATRSLAAASDSLAQRFGGMVSGFDHFNRSLQAQMTSMQAIAGSLDRTKHTLDESAGIWVRSAAPVLASVEASQRVASELGQVADHVSLSQRDMAEMAKAVTQLTDKASGVWDNYRNRFEKVDGDLQAVFERLQGGTHAFGKEVMDFVGQLDASMAEGMSALSIGTDELRKVAEILVRDVREKAA